jgi:hypothetical protein
LIEIGLQHLAVEGLLGAEMVMSRRRIDAGLPLDLTQEAAS